jgi:hypothetical protein
MAIFTAITGFVAATFGISLVAAGVVTNLVIGAALTGLSMLFGPKPPRLTQQPTPQASATINQSIGARVRGYGRARLGGTRAFWESRNGFLYQAVMMHSGEIDGIEEWFIGDVNVALSGTSVSNFPFTGFVDIDHHLGSPTQTADQILEPVFPQWTSAHRLRGIAYFVSRYASPAPADYSRVFPEGYNTTIRATCRLTKVFDPRTSATAWSDNPALCILDYLTHPDGYRRSLDDIDIASFAAFANVCDETVALAGGGSEKRYRLWGIYQLNEDPQDVLYRMRAACDAEFYQTQEGKIAIRGGKWKVPTVTISDRDILAHQIEQGNNRFAAFNELKILYTSPQHDYQTMEAPTWADLTDQAERGVIVDDLALDMVPSPTQARRLAKIHIAKSNPKWRGVITTNLNGLNALGERIIRVVIPELQIDDAFHVVGFSIRPDLTGCELTIAEIGEAAYTWSTAEEAENAPIAQDTRPDADFPVPVISTLEQVEDSLVVRVEVEGPGRPDLQLEAQIREGAGGLWFNMQVEGSAYEAFSGDRPLGSNQVRVRWLGAQSTAGAWSATSNIDVIDPA